MGLEWSDLFVDSVIPWNPGSKYRANVFNGFRRRRQFQTLRTGDELRQRDAARLTALSAFEDGSFDEEVLYICLAEIYRGYSELEYQFEILRTGSDEEALELFHG
jgi:hypothetical protein